MARQLYVGLIAEGETDYRFLIPLIERVLTAIAFELKGQIDVDIRKIDCKKGSSFNEFVINAAMKCKDEHMNLFIVHTDADDSTNIATYTNKINAARTELDKLKTSQHCEYFAALVPIYMTEAWMIADKELLIENINYKKSEQELNLNGDPESFTNPKERIIKGIQIGRADMPPKIKNSLNIGQLYEPLGTSIKIDKLKKLTSFQDFESNLRKELHKLNFY